MAEVWAAHDLELDRRVAVKLLGPDADPARFEREARAVAALSHPNICRLFDYGTTDEGRRYMVLEYLPGGTLEERLPAAEPLPDDESLRIASEMAAGLAHAHARDVVHRDLKPANVLFTSEGEAKIADFGIARLGGAGTLTETGTLLGTAAYISPEQAAGRPAGPASDVYSFGVILFRLLTGQLPFEGDSSLELAAKHVQEPPPAVQDLRPDAPAGAAALVAAALAKDPADRPADGAALLEALGGEPTTQVLRPAEAVTQVIPSRRGRPPRAALIAIPAVLLLGAAGVGLALLATGNDSEGSPPPTTRVHSASQTGSGSSTTTRAATGTTRPTTRQTTPSTTQSQRTTTTVPTTNPTLPTTVPTTLPTTTASIPTTTSTVTTTVPTIP